MTRTRQEAEETPSSWRWRVIFATVISAVILNSVINILYGMKNMRARTMNMEMDDIAVAPASLLARDVTAEDRFDALAAQELGTDDMRVIEHLEWKEEEEEDSMDDEDEPVKESHLSGDNTDGNKDPSSTVHEDGGEDEKATLDSKTEDNEKEHKPLNVVILYPDDWRHDTIGAAETQIVLTPHLDALAKRGIRFTHNCVTTSICWVSRGTLFTGQYASRHKALKLKDPYFYNTWNTSWPYLLQSKGDYFVGHVGKWQYRSPYNDLEARNFFNFTHFHEVGNSRLLLGAHSEQCSCLIFFSFTLIFLYG